MIEVHLASQEKLQVPVVADVDPTAFGVSWSITAEGAALSWTSGTWRDTPGEQLGNSRWRGITHSPMIGAGGLDLAAGTYVLHVQVAGGAAGVPVKPVGYLRIR